MDAWKMFEGIFITPETREKIKEAAGERSEKDVSQYADVFTMHWIKR